MSRHGKRWTTEENDKMFKMIAENIEIKEISEIIGRSCGSILSRLNKQIYVWFEIENKSIDWIISQTPFDSIQYIQDIINNEKFKIKEKQKWKEQRKEKKEQNNEKYKKNEKSDIEEIKKDISDIKLMLRGIMSILEEITVEE